MGVVAGAQDPTKLCLLGTPRLELPGGAVHALDSNDAALRPGPETAQLAGSIESPAALPRLATSKRPSVPPLRPPRLVGRAAEWQRLQGRRRVLVDGEPGIGKSRLLEELVASEDGARLFGARLGDAALPYALVARLMLDLAREFGAPPAGSAGQALAQCLQQPGVAAPVAWAALHLQDALADALEGWRTQGLERLVIDDLHFADPASLDLLLPLAAAAAESGPAWLLATREREPSQPLRSWLGGETVRPFERIALGPLEPHDVEVLLESLALPGLNAAAWAPPLARHTRGNPLLLLVTLSAMLDSDPAAASEGRPPLMPQPALIGGLIERRLGQLGAPALELARLAALAGPDFSVELAAAVLGQHPLDVADAWCELEAAQIMHAGAFAHDLVAEATLRSVPQPIAQLMHCNIAEVLQQRHAPPARLARHWAEGGKRRLAAAAWEAAARQAEAAARRAEEADCWARAARTWAEAGDRSAAFEARRCSVEALSVARPLGEAVAMTESLVAEALTAQERLGALLAHATVMLASGRPELADAAAEEAIALARALARPWDEFEASRRAAVALARQGHGSKAAGLLAGFAARVQDEGTARQRHGYWSDLAEVHELAQRRHESLQAWQHAIGLAEALGQRHAVAACATRLAGLAGLLGQPARAQAAAERAWQLRSEHGENAKLANGASEMMLAVWDTALGHYGRALTLYDSASARFDDAQSSAWLATCDSHRATAFLHLGQTGRAQQALARPMPANTPTLQRARRLIVQGRIDRARGSSALPALTAARQLMGEDDLLFTRLLCELDRSRELSPAAAAALCADCRERAEKVEMVGLGIKARLFALEAELRGQQGGASPASSGGEALALRALLQERRPQDLYWPEALWIVHRALWAAGEAHAAQEVLEEARLWIERQALPQVAVDAQEAFLRGNPVNLALSQAWQRLKA